MSHDSDPESLLPDEDDVVFEIALLKREVRAMHRTHRTVAGALWGLVIVGAVALLTIGAYKERVDQLDNRVSRIEARPYLASTHGRNDPP